MLSGLKFCEIFSSSTKDTAIKNQQDYLVEKLGGPNIYSSRKQKVGIIRRHTPYLINEESIDRWLYHMKNALEMNESWDTESSSIILNFFRFQAFFIKKGKELLNADTFIGYGVPS